MKLPRRGILIRLAIYVPVISFLAWNAFFKGRCNADEQAAPVQQDVGKKRTMTMPDGSEIQYLELTPDEARSIGFDPGPLDEASKAEAPAKADAKKPAD